MPFRPRRPEAQVISRAIEEFSGGATPSDDRTLVVVRRNAEADG
jgi:hypothetical protein